VFLGDRSYTFATSGNYRKETEGGLLIVKSGAQFNLSNSNLALAEQLGLANPASIAWELVPFSFVVDWFTNYGSVIGGLSSWAGYTISKPYTTRLFKGRVIWVTGDNYQGSHTYDTYRLTKFRCSRDKVLVGPLPSYPRWFDAIATSKTRAATAVSLLTQLMLNK
jgi:hypothetical protein